MLFTFHIRISDLKQIYREIKSASLKGTPSRIFSDNKSPGQIRLNANSHINQNHKI